MVDQDIIEETMMGLIHKEYDRNPEKVIVIHEHVEIILHLHLVHCLAVSGLQNYREGPRMAGITSDDCNKLQVI